MSGAKAKKGVMLRGIGAIALLCLLSACVNAPTTITPATQTAVLDPRNGNGNGDGIGGTGIKQAQVTPRGDGIGGTGVIGTIRGFGSILVNGLKLEFNHATTVESDGKPTSLEDLRVGQVVQGVAHTRDGQLHLDKLEIQHAVSGPINAIDYAAETMTVLGQKVRLNLAGDKAAGDAFKTLQKGDVVSISGLRLADGTIMATRVDQRRDDGRIVVRGDAAAVTAASVRVGDLDIPLGGSAAMLSAPKTGGRVFASGRMVNNQFVPDVIAGGAAQPFSGDVTNVSLEAYVPADALKGGALNIHGVAVDGASLPAGTAANDRVVVTGHVGTGDRINATEIAKVRTMVSILNARGSMRPTWVRPEMSRPDRVRPPERPDRPQSIRPDVPARPDRPQIEKPGGGCC